MTRDDRFYAFIVARTSRSRSHIKRISMHKRWLKAAALVLVVVAGFLLYGFYGLTQQAAHLRTEHENQRLRAENESLKRELGRAQEQNRGLAARIAAATSRLDSLLQQLPESTS